jgi:hypothetical protein
MLPPNIYRFFLQALDSSSKPWIFPPGPRFFLYTWNAENRGFPIGPKHKIKEIGRELRGMKGKRKEDSNKLLMSLVGFMAVDLWACQNAQFNT